jgi:hypothetical protein
MTKRQIKTRRLRRAPLNKSEYLDYCNLKKRYEDFKENKPGRAKINYGEISILFKIEARLKKYGKE